MYVLCPLLMMHCVVFVVVQSPPYPWRRQQRLVATLFIGIHHNRSRLVVSGERIGGGRAGLVPRYNNQSVEKTQTIYPPCWRSCKGREGKEEREGEVKLLLFVLWRCDYGVRFGSHATINPWGRGDMNNLRAWARMRMRRRKHPSPPHVLIPQPP